MFINGGAFLEKFDVCIIGGGPAGYVSALKCAINGLSAAIIEKRKIRRHMFKQRLYSDEGSLF
jgi:Pyruvate/2-oxoglutarate dehydrogenase complex, dihydrolipoamide dehydrogenase (E3) component, and related enzymes